MMQQFKKSLQSFNQYAKESGLPPILELSDQEVDQATSFIRQLKGRPFWYWSQDEHREIIRQHKGACPCFNHFVKLPRDKTGTPKPLHQFQKVWYEALQTNKYLLLRKPVNAGATTFFLRWAIWMATRDDALRGKEVAILCGPNELLAQALIQRIRQVFLANDVVLEGNKTSVTINDCVFATTPSNHLDALRSKTGLKIILADELDYFKQDRAILREVMERYITKSDPYIICCSTPGPINSLMYEMEHELNSIYTKVAIDYQDATEMYSAHDIEIARRSPSFQRDDGPLWRDHGQRVQRVQHQPRGPR